MALVTRLLGGAGSSNLSVETLSFSISNGFSRGLS
ncbi:hypothetical protein [Enterococcus phage PEF1]